MVNVSKYRGPRFLKLADVEAHPFEDTIENVLEGKFGLDLYFTSSGIVTLNVTSINKLAEAWGDESKHWISLTAKAYAGDIPFGAGFKRGVIVEPVSPPLELDFGGEPIKADAGKPWDETKQIKL